MRNSFIWSASVILLLQTWQTFKIRPRPWIIYWIWYQSMRSRLWWWPIDHIYIFQRSSKIIFSLFHICMDDHRECATSTIARLFLISTHLKPKSTKFTSLHQCVAMADWCQRWCLTKPQISNQPYDGMNPRWCKIPKSQRICSLRKRNAGYH